VLAKTINSFGDSPMKKTNYYPARQPVALICLAACLISQLTTVTRPQESGAARLLNEGTYYQSGDDISDRAADSYRQLILKYPKTTQAEQAQFFLGTYYQNKFFIVEYRQKRQDWSSFNQAEDALRTYITKYPRGSYLADAYYSLALISLRRGYNNQYRQDAKSLLDMMSKQGVDGQIYVYKVVWSPYPEDVVKLTCQKNSLAAGELTLINRISTFEGFRTASGEWCRNNCK
jgi:hypothetical protein